MEHLKLMVCPHDTAKNPENWFNFAQYLTQTIHHSFLFEKSLDFPDFHNQLTSSALVYANPQDSVKLIREHGYLPVARPSNLSDEIIFVANKNMQAPKVTDLTDKTVASVNSMMVTRVGIKCLLENNIKPLNIDHKESWMAVVKSIFRNEAEYGMIYKDFYEGLNGLSKSGLQKIGETSDGTIHHNLLTSPVLKNSMTDIQTCLLQMHQHNDKSHEILTALHIDKFMPVSIDEILHFESLQAFKIAEAADDHAVACCC